jgi:hypothetical protein
MAGASPQSASGSIFDTLARLLPQSGGIMKASDALGMANAQNADPKAQKAALAAQLAAMKAKGPVDGHYSKAWQDQVNDLERRVNDIR